MGRAAHARELARPVPEAFMEMVVEETCKPPARVWRAALQGMIDARPEPPGTILAPALLRRAQEGLAAQERVGEGGGVVVLAPVARLPASGPRHRSRWKS